MRGKIVSIQQLSTMSGIMIQYFCSFGFAQTSGDLSWRAPFGLMAIPGAILGSVMFIFPESPRWLMDRDRNEEALQILGDVHAAGDTEDGLVQLEYHEIRKQIDFDRTQAARSYMDLFAPDVRLRVFIGMSDQMWSQLGGMVRPRTVFSQTLSELTDSSVRLLYRMVRRLYTCESVCTTATMY